MVGKKIGKDNIYIHVSALSELPKHLRDRILDALEVVPVEFMFNFVITHQDYISFLIVKDFDTTFEPVLGERWKVDNNKNAVYIQCPDKPKVLHQRYKTVKDDYKGFDLEQDRLREKWYRQYFSAKDMSGAGYQHKWKQMLEKISKSI